MVLETRALSHVFADGKAGLQDCSVAIARGSRNALLGANGSGKTTLLQHFNGLLRPSSGEVYVDGAPVQRSRGGLADLRRRVGLVFQNPDSQLFSASVREDVSFGPLNLGLAADEVARRVADALAQVDMAAYAERPVHRLSYGQKKRVCIAGVLAMAPEVLLLDEPMAGLDGAMQAELEAVLDGLAAQGITIVLSTHDVDFAYGWADRIHLLAAGRCIGAFAAAELPEQGAAMAAAGQNMPVVIELHRALAARGVVSATPPRSLAALLRGLQQREPASSQIEQ